MFRSPTSHDDLRRLQRRLTLSWLLMVLAVLLILILPLIRGWWSAGPSGRPRAVTPRGTLADFEQTTANVFREVSPSVVFITTRAQVADPWNRRVTEVEAGTGSGFVWDDQGHIVTNFHVIRNASSARVVFSDQSAYEATLVGASPDHDLAVLRVRTLTARLRPVLIGESHDLLVGQATFAIGNPFGLSHTLTTGVVSARSRRIEGPSGRLIDDVIQIDAAINPGNSGGPLLDSAGRLIGVNTAIYSPSGASAGVGFAVPVDTVNRVVPQIIAKGRYQPPQLGIRINDELNRSVVERLGVKGVLILAIEPDGPAAEAGLRGTRIAPDGSITLGDIVQQVGDEKIETVNELFNALEHHQVGAEIELSFLRDGKSQTATVRLR